MQKDCYLSTHGSFKIIVSATSEIKILDPYRTTIFKFVDVSTRIFSTYIINEKLAQKFRTGYTDRDK